MESRLKEFANHRAEKNMRKYADNRAADIMRSQHLAQQFGFSDLEASLLQNDLRLGLMLEANTDLPGSSTQRLERVSQELEGETNEARQRGLGSRMRIEAGWVAMNRQSQQSIKQIRYNNAHTLEESIGLQEAGLHGEHNTTGFNTTSMRIFAEDVAVLYNQAHRKGVRRDERQTLERALQERIALARSTDELHSQPSRESRQLEPVTIQTSEQILVDILASVTSAGQDAIKKWTTASVEQQSNPETEVMNSIQKIEGAFELYPDLATLILMAQLEPVFSETEQPAYREAQDILRRHAGESLGNFLDSGYSEAIQEGYNPAELTDPEIVRPLQRMVRQLSGDEQFDLQEGTTAEDARIDAENMFSAILNTVIFGARSRLFGSPVPASNDDSTISLGMLRAALDNQLGQAAIGKRNSFSDDELRKLILFHQVLEQPLR